MVSREGLIARRDELLARREALMEYAANIREHFQDNVDADAVMMAAGLSMMSGGVAWGLTQALRGRRGLFALAAPAALTGLGLVIAGRGAMGRRRAHIVAAEERVREELSGLDPIARAQVLRDMSAERFALIRHAHN